MAAYEDILWLKNCEEHNSPAQKSIWYCIMMLAKFEEVKVSIDGFDDKSVIKGENEFYTFMKTLYQDMYKNPDTYAIPTAEYNEYINGINPEKVFANTHKSDAKESKLRNRFLQAIQFYSDIFWKLGLAADEICNEKYELEISKSKYDSVLKSLDHPHIKNENLQRLNALANRGIAVNKNSKKYYVSCKKAPKMFLGLKVLLTVPESIYKTENKFKRLNYLRLDYKGYYRPMPEINDVKLTMKKEHSDILTLLLQLFEGFKTRYALYPMACILPFNKWKVDYWLGNNKRIFGFYASPDFLSFRISFKTPENLMRIINILEKNDIKLFEWFRDNIKEVFHDCPRNKIIMFGNQKKHLCCGSSGGTMEIVNPNKNDIKKIIALIKIINE
jgi:hypothetical protein